MLRTPNQYSGDLGEVQVFMQLLRLGAAVNLLTASDSGWDIHLHLPKEPQVFPPDPTKCWELSGRSAHVQVKRMTSTSYPKVKLGTVRGWLTGSNSGTPTFVILVRQSPESPEPNFLYITPLGLAKLLKNSGDEPDGDSNYRTLSKEYWSEYSQLIFAHELALWSRYPLALFHLNFKLSSTPTPNPDVIAEIVARVASGILSFHHVPNGEDGSWRKYVNNIIPFSVTNVLGDSAVEKIARGASLSVSSNVFRGEFISDLPVSTYTTAEDPPSTIEAANRFIGALLSYTFRIACLKDYKLPNYYT